MPNFLGTKHPARNFDLLSFYGMEWNEMQEKNKELGLYEKKYKNVFYSLRISYIVSLFRE